MSDPALSKGARWRRARETAVELRGTFLALGMPSHHARKPLPATTSGGESVVYLGAYPRAAAALIAYGITGQECEGTTEDLRAAFKAAGADEHDVDKIHDWTDMATSAFVAFGCVSLATAEALLAAIKTPEPAQ
jgi:hypothetical protein